MRIRLLGPLRIEGDRGEVAVGAAKERALLAALALDPGAVVPTEALIAALWGDDPPRSARKTLQTYVSNLRRLLGADRIITDAAGYALASGSVTVDVSEFRTLVRSGEAAQRAGDLSAARVAFGDAAALWRGDPLADVPGSARLDGEATRLQEERLCALEERIAADLAHGDQQGLVGELESLTALHPFRERLWCLLMVALYRSGRQRDALAVYRRVRKVLLEELGVEPGPELRALEQAVLAQAPELAAGVGVAQLEPTVPTSVGNLVRPTTSFVGRHRELQEVTALLTRPGVATLTGPGGVGKTRLALEAAGAVAGRFADAVWVVELAAVADARAVPEVVANALGVRAPADEDALAAVGTALRPRRCLLVLDGCEHLLPGVSESIAQVNRSCPLVSVLTTSRQPLVVPGERLWPVEPLQVPVGTDAHLEELRTNPSIALFVERATAVRPAFALTTGNAACIAEVCRRLDGLPLALELAAGQMRSIGPADLARRLDGRFRLLRGGSPSDQPHHRTLRAAVEWSYELLAEPERCLFDRLSVFSAEFGIDDAEEVCASSASERADVAGLLCGLVDASMLVCRQMDDGTSRYHLLDTLRDYGRERLASRGEDLMFHRRHAEYFAAVASRARSGIRSADEGAWVEAMDLVFDDVRAAHGWAVADRDVELASAIAADMMPFEGRNRAEVLSWAEAAIAMPGAERAERYADACAAAARRAGLQGDLSRAAELGRRSIAAAQARGVPPPFAALYAAALPGFAEASEDAVAQHLRWRDLALSVADHQEAANAQAFAAMVTAYRGDTEAALAMADEAVALARRVGAHLVPRMGYLYGEILHEVDPARAATHLEEALGAFQDARDAFHAGITMVSLASLHARHGDGRRALELFIDVVASWSRQGAWRQQWITLRNVAELLARLELHVEAAVVLAATDAAPAAPPLYGAQAERLAELRKNLETEIGSDHMQLATDHGNAMTDEAAVNFAASVMRDALRDRFNAAVPAADVSQGGRTRSDRMRATTR